MGHRVPLDQQGLRQIRSRAIIEAYGHVQYRVVGSVMRLDEPFLRAPYYRWVFVSGVELGTPQSPMFVLPDALKEALWSAEACQGSQYLEGWGLFRYTACGIELIPDAGPLAEDHPHAGWLPVSIPSRRVSPGDHGAQTLTREAFVGSRGSRPKGSLDFRISSRLLLTLVAGFLWISLLGGLRVGLMGDGVEPVFRAGWAQAHWPSTLNASAESLTHWAALRSVYVPGILSSAVSVPKQTNSSALNSSPLEIGEDPNVGETMPRRLVVLGLYSSRDGAFQWQATYRRRGYEAMIYRRKVPGKGILFAVALPYQGLNPLQFLRQVRTHLLRDAWLLEDRQSLIPDQEASIPDQELTAQGLSL